MLGRDDYAGWRTAPNEANANQVAQRRRGPRAGARNREAPKGSSPRWYQSLSHLPEAHLVAGRDGCAVVASGEGGCCGGVGVPLSLFPRSVCGMLRCFAGCTPYSPSPPFSKSRPRPPPSPTIRPAGACLFGTSERKKASTGVVVACLNLTSLAPSSLALWAPSVVMLRRV